MTFRSFAENQCPMRLHELLSKVTFDDLVNTLKTLMFKEGQMGKYSWKTDKTR